MNSTTRVDFDLLCFGLVGVGIVLAIALNVVFGGFKVGKLSRRLELVLPAVQLAAFVERFRHRLAELGFQPGPVAGQYVQSGAQFGNLASHTHAKSPKLLEIAVDESDPRQATVSLSLRYLNTIVGDTGETTYADAVLKYVSNETDSMKLVANRIFMAFSTLVLAVWTWIAMLGLKAFRIEPFLGRVVVLGVTPAITSIIAIVTIALKPGELRGIWLVVLGIVISLLALGTGVVLAIR
jgi:hypothetical protein